MHSRHSTSISDTMPSIFLSAEFVSATKKMGNTDPTALPRGENRDPHEVEMSLSEGGNQAELMYAGQLRNNGWASAAAIWPKSTNAYVAPLDKPH
jgi:hypothetical protein